MNKLLVTLLLSSFLITAILPAASGVTAQPYIQSVKIVDQNNVDHTGKTLVAGGTYKVSFTLNVNVTREGSELILETYLQKVEDIYWRLTGDYEGIDTGTWRPGQPTLPFKEVEGQAQLSVIGRIPQNYTTDTIAPDLTRHFERNFTLVVLRFPDGRVLEKVEAPVTDETIQKYNTLHMEREKLINSTAVESRFSSLYRSVLDLAEVFKAQGDVEQAILLVEALPSEPGELPQPPQVNAGTTYLYGMVGLVVVVVVVGVMWFRARGKADYTVRRVDDQAKKLDMTLVRLYRIDKNLADEVNSVKEELQRIVRE